MFIGCSFPDLPQGTGKLSGQIIQVVGDVGYELGVEEGQVQMKGTQMSTLTLRSVALSTRKEHQDQVAPHNEPAGPHNSRARLRQKANDTHIQERSSGTLSSAILLRFDHSPAVG